LDRNGDLLDEYGYRTTSVRQPGRVAFIVSNEYDKKMGENHIQFEIKRKRDRTCTGIEDLMTFSGCPKIHIKGVVEIMLGLWRFKKSYKYCSIINYSDLYASWVKDIR